MKRHISDLIILLITILLGLMFWYLFNLSFMWYMVGVGIGYIIIIWAAE